ncbi:LOW QUALITY PROTEIN: zinc transporter ZIP1 [Leptosomus discolor]
MGTPRSPPQRSSGCPPLPTLFPGCAAASARSRGWAPGSPVSRANPAKSHPPEPHTGRREGRAPPPWPGALPPLLGATGGPAGLPGRAGLGLPRYSVPEVPGGSSERLRGGTGSPRPGSRFAAAADRVGAHPHGTRSSRFLLAATRVTQRYRRGFSRRYWLATRGAGSALWNAEDARIQCSERSGSLRRCEARSRRRRVGASPAAGVEGPASEPGRDGGRNGDRERAEELAWSPAAPRPPPGLEAKLGSLVLLLLLPLACGPRPLCCFRQPPSSADAHSPVLSLVSCFAGGVLATCLLDLLPDYLASISAALEGLRITLQFPLPEFILAMGFFLVLVLEQVALAQREPPSSSSSVPEETRALLLPSGSIQTPSPQPPAPSARGAVRAGLLVLALALHAVLEGLALGLQEAEGAVLRVCLALLLHKCAVAFSLALKLLRGRLRAPAVAACLVLFAMMSPLGVGLGTVVAAGAGLRQRLCRGVLEGLAAGTFLYITFLEILPQELGVPQHRVPKVILLLAGFALVTAILFIKI